MAATSSQQNSRRKAWLPRNSTYKSCLPPRHLPIPHQDVLGPYSGPQGLKEVEILRFIQGNVLDSSEFDHRKIIKQNFSPL